MGLFVKRLVFFVISCALFAYTASGGAWSAKQPKVKRYFVAAPLAQLKGIGLVPEQIIGLVGMIVTNEAGLRKLKSLHIPYEVKEIGELPLDPVYLAPQEIETKMSALAGKHADKAEWVALNKRFGGPLSAGRRPLKALRIRAPLTDTKPRPILLLDSLHHARELITPMVTYDAATYLLEKGASDPRVKRWLDYFEIWIVPIVNPDGYDYVFSKEPYWRKNRRDNGDGSYGVDLNRNYPFLWGRCGKNSDVGNSEVYRGGAAGSEPETQTMLAMGKALRPHLYLTYHSYGNEIIRPYMCAHMAEEKLVQSLALQLASAASYSARKASSSGESFEHFYQAFGAIGFLVEVGDAFHPLPENIPGFIASARTTWQTMLERGMKAALRGVVVDASGAPVEAELSLDEITFKAGEIRKSRKDHGGFFWLLPGGNYTLRVKAKGYLPWSRIVTVPEDKALELRVELVSSGDDTPLEPVTNEPPKQEPSAEPSQPDKATTTDQGSADQPTPKDTGAVVAADTKADKGAQPTSGGCGCSMPQGASGLWLGLACFFLFLSVFRR